MNSPRARYRVHPALRLLPLPLSIALCLPALADDKPESWALCPINEPIPAFAGTAEPDPENGTPMEQREARAEQATTIDGDHMGGNRDNLEYQGNVALRRGDQFLGADNLAFNQEDNTYVADGNVRYQDSGIRLIAESARGNQDQDNHQIDNVRYQLVSRRGNGGADRIEMNGPEGNMYHSTYSTCDPDDRWWELRARRIEVNTDTGWGVARASTIRLGNVPIMFVPWVKFPIDDRRHTGLLYPAIGLSGRNGFDYEQPIYLNLAPNYDATLSPRYMSERGTSLGAEFRYMYRGGRGIIEGNYMPSDDLLQEHWNDFADGSNPPTPNKLANTPDPGDSRGMLRYSGYHNLDEHWQARANLTWLSDPRYTEDFGNSIAGLATTSTTSTIGLYGNGLGWTAGIMADTWQLTDYTTSELSLPYNRLPRLYANWDRPFGPWLKAGVYAEAVNFQHNERDDGSRIDIKPYISMPLQGASWFVTPTLAWRQTSYRLDPELADQRALISANRYVAENGGSVTPELVARLRDESPSRNMPIGSLDAGLFFDRETKFGGTSYLHTLEPRLFYLNVPYRDQSAIPVFDTRAFTYSWGQMFRDNRYTSADRQADANQLTLALSTRFLRESDGFERLSASIGQITYFEDSRVTLDGESPIEKGKSAWVADANWAPSDRWTIGAAYQYDPKYHREDLASVRARYLVGSDGVVNLSYRRRYEQFEQGDFSFLYPITPSWSVVGRYYYSFSGKTPDDDNKLLEGIAGVQWDSCCLAVRALVRRYVRNREGEMNNSFQVEFVLKGLGSAGQNTERTLRRGILGYYRDDLYLVPPSNTTVDPDDDIYDVPDMNL
ncbi:LPS assembly protein LptD [Pseudoxanthomonas dokdonensis]|uniref:LPS-assembly protein LptD n=1 Tax=Pseudoxanthomonas dokdonensis TaxID=344882 RepID=A0A0R0CZN0_9GAMM|nr:LPS assembly protein LptD [Pseudoxanthomonas dokdonensis]KRG71236.1 organic solvent tolerance protein [Pseudoxanthomonas dokdonensis]